MSDDNERPIPTVELPSQINAFIMRAGHNVGPRITRHNDEGTRLAVEYYYADQLSKAATERREAARSAVYAHVKLPAAKGKHVVEDNSAATVIADNRSSPRTLNAEAVTSLLIKRLDISIEEAVALVDECRTGKPGFTTSLSVVLK